MSPPIHRDISIWLAVLALNAASVSALDFFVATEGADTNPGTESMPFATPEGARDAIRHRKATKGLKENVTVWMKGGTYLRTQSFVLTEHDSGSKEAPITYRAVKDQSVRLLGGQTISNFRPVADPEVLSRFAPMARGHVVEADLRAEGVTDFGRLRSRGFGRPISPAYLEVFFKGRPMTLARWPNEGEWQKIAGFPESGGQGDEHGGKIGVLDTGFFFATDRPNHWKASNDIWVHGYWAWDWANSYERVASLDLEKRWVKTAFPHGLYGFRKGQRFYFINVLEELDQPGEWFLDENSGKLYFWPPENKPSEVAGPDSSKKLSVLVSMLEKPFIALNNVSNITFRGLVIEAGRGDGVTIKGGENNRIAGCTIRDLGNYGIVIDGGRNNGVIGCDIANTGDGGVNLSGGDRQTLTPGGQYVENCHFQKQGRWSKCYVPAILISGVGNRASHNLIHDHPHCGILFSGNDHLIEFNDIHHVALETGDVGAIYAGRDWTFRGNIIRNNFIHETGGVGMGSMGVYMDDCISGTEISGNVFFKVSRAAFLGGGRDHRVENNVFVDCQPAISLDGRGLDASPVWHDMVFIYMKKQLEAVPRELYRQRYPAIKDLDRYYESQGDSQQPPTAPKGVPPENNIAANNICVRGKWTEIHWHADPMYFELRNNYVGSDPGFVSPEKLDFSLKESSPVLQNGFRQIAMKRIGLYRDEFRQDAERGGEAIYREPTSSLATPRP